METTYALNENGALQEIKRPPRIGFIKTFAGATPPEGTLLCDGSAVSRDTYSELFAAIGTTWGEGDGSTTFNLPDLRNKWVVGSGSLFANGATIEASLPEITGTIGSAQILIGGTQPSHAVNYTPTGALSVRTYEASGTSPVSGVSGELQTQNTTIVFHASSYNDIYGKHESWGVVPASVAVLPCIVYE